MLMEDEVMLPSVTNWWVSDRKLRIQLHRELLSKSNKVKTNSNKVTVKANLNFAFYMYLHCNAEKGIMELSEAN